MTANWDNQPPRVYAIRPEFIPTTKQVRDGYAEDPEGDYHNPISAPANFLSLQRAFDRWLAQHDAERDAKNAAMITKALGFINRGLLDSAVHVLTQEEEAK